MFAALKCCFKRRSTDTQKNNVAAPPPASAQSTSKHTAFFKPVERTPVRQIFLKELTVNILLQAPEDPALNVRKETRVKDAWTSLEKITAADFNKSYLFTDNDPFREESIGRIELLIWCAMEYYKKGEGVEQKELVGGTRGSSRSVYEDLLYAFVANNHALLQQNKAWIATQVEQHFTNNPLKSYFLPCLSYFIDHIVPGIYAEGRQISSTGANQQALARKTLRPRAIIVPPHKERYEQYKNSHTSPGPIATALGAAPPPDEAATPLSADPSSAGSRVFHPSQSFTAPAGVFVPEDDPEPVSRDGLTT